MLVITRKEGERIVIDDDIVITVVESKRESGSKPRHRWRSHERNERRLDPSSH